MVPIMHVRDAMNFRPDTPIAVPRQDHTSKEWALGLNNVENGTTNVLNGVSLIIRLLVVLGILRVGVMKFVEDTQ